MLKCPQMASDLEAAVLGEAWPCPEVSVHTCYIYTPGHRWPPSPKNKRLNYVMHTLDFKHRFWN